MESPGLRYASVRGPGVQGGVLAAEGGETAGTAEPDFPGVDGSRTQQQHVGRDITAIHQQYQQRPATNVSLIDTQ